MFSTKQAEVNLFSQNQAKRPCLDTSIGQFSKLPTENKLLQPKNEKGSDIKSSLASQRRQELLSNLPIYQNQVFSQKIKLDLSNPLLKTATLRNESKTNISSTILSTKIGQQSEIGFKHLPNKISSKSSVLGSNLNTSGFGTQNYPKGPKNENVSLDYKNISSQNVGLGAKESPEGPKTEDVSQESLDPVVGGEMETFFNSKLSDNQYGTSSSKFKEVLCHIFKDDKI